MEEGHRHVPSFTAFAKVTLWRALPQLIATRARPAWKTTCDQIAHGEEASAPWLGRFYFGTETRVCTAWSPTGWPTSTHERSTRFRSAPTRTGSRSSPGPAATRPYLRRGEELPASPIRWRRTSLRSRKPSSCCRPRAATANWAAIRPPGCPFPSGREGSGRTSSSASKKKEQAEVRPLFKSIDPEEVTLEVALQLLSLHAGSRAWTRRTTRRSLPPTVATDRISRRAPRPDHSKTKNNCSRSASTRRSCCCPSQNTDAANKLPPPQRARQ